MPPSEAGAMTATEIGAMLLYAGKVAEREREWRKTLLKALGARVR